MSLIVLRLLAAGTLLLWGVTLTASGGAVRAWIGVALLMGVPWLTASAAAHRVALVVLHARAQAEEMLAEQKRESGDVPPEREVS